VERGRFSNSVAPNGPSDEGVGRVNAKECIRQIAGGVEIDLKVVPGASRSRVVGRLGSALKVQVAAPPEKGKANAAVVKLIAKALGIGEKAVQIVKGETSPNKRIRVMGVTPEAAAGALGLGA